MAEPRFAECPKCQMRWGVPAYPDNLPVRALAGWVNGTALLACAGCGKRWEELDWMVAVYAGEAEQQWNRRNMGTFRDHVRRVLDLELAKVARLREGKW